MSSGQRVSVWLPILVFFLAAALQLAFLQFLPERLRGNDSADFLDFYSPVAKSLVAGEGLVYEERLAMRYPPGYPVLLAGVFWAAEKGPGEEQDWLVGFNVVCFALAAALLFRLARRLSNSRAIAWWTVIAWITWPPLLWLGKQPNSEMPFLCLFFFALLLWVRSFAEKATYWSGLDAGLVLGLAALVRPAVIAVCLPLALATLFVGWISGRRRVAAALLLCVGQVLVMAPWVYWMHHQTGGWFPLSSGGRLSVLDGLTIAVKPERSGPPVPADVKRLMTAVDEGRPDFHSTGDVLRFVAAQDGPAVTKLVAIKAARSWYATDSLRFENWLLILQIPYLLLAASGLAVAWRQGGARRSLVLIVILVALYFWAMTMLVLSILRYMVPAMALLLLAGALAVDHGLRGRSLRGRSGQTSPG